MGCFSLAVPAEFVSFPLKTHLMRQTCIPLCIALKMETQFRYKSYFSVLKRKKKDTLTRSEFSPTSYCLFLALV